MAVQRLPRPPKILEPLDINLWRCPCIRGSDVGRGPQAEELSKVVDVKLKVRFMIKLANKMLFTHRVLIYFYEEL